MFRFGQIGDTLAALPSLWVLRQQFPNDRESLARDGQIAQQFARQFTPERYREQIRNLLQRLL